MKTCIDLAGQTFGRLTVLRRAGKNSSGNSKWDCRCECGKTIVALDSNLKRGTTRSCGCLGHGRKRTDLASQAFGRLTVIREATRAKHGQVRWECKCVCGGTCIVWGSSLRGRRTISCGCVQKERTRAAHRVLHGHSSRGHITPEFTSWLAMIQRCENPRQSGYAYYGRAGVEVCKRWRENFESFIADLGPRPMGTTLGRYLDLGDYDPHNCKWMTKAEQVAEQQKKRALRKSTVLPIAA